jgi:hemolysin III
VLSNAVAQMVLHGGPVSLTRMELPRWTLGRMQNPVRGFLHGGAAIAAVVATVFLGWVAPNWGIRIGAIVFGLAMVALYTTSSLYHAIPWREVWKKRMQRIDHLMILVLIAGTYTPVAIATLSGWLQGMVLAIAWGLVALGALQHVFFPQQEQTFSMILAISMGWIGVAIGWRFFQELGWAGSGLAVAGGLIYSIGMLLLITNRPRLWPRVFSYHEVFHIMVVTASVIHFVMIWRYVLPRGT